MRVPRTLMGVAAGLLSWVALTSLAQAEWKFSGYTQTRFNMLDSDLGDDAFDVRRARIKAEGPVGTDTTMKIQFDLAKLDDTGGGSVELKDLLLTRKLNDQWTGTVGYTSTPFGFEVPYSSSKRLLFERSRAANALFPGERDLGVYLHYKPESSSAPEVLAGFSNGMAKWYEADKAGNKDTGTEAFVARAQWQLGDRGVAGVSFRHASRTRTVTTTAAATPTKDYSDNLFGVHARYSVLDNLTVQGEYYDGSDLEVDVTGYYGQAEYHFGETPYTAFYRYDAYDFGGSDDYARHSGGVAYQRDKNERVTLQAESYDDGKGSSFTNYGLQYQYSY